MSRMPPSRRSTLSLNRPTPPAAAPKPAKAKAAKPPPPPRRTPEEKAARTLASLRMQKKEHKAAIERRVAARTEHLADFAQRFPATFNPERPVPLAIGVDKALKRETGLSWNATYTALRFWTRQPAYLLALMAGGPRHALDGTVDGEVTDAQRAEAAARLEAQTAKAA